MKRIRFAAVAIALFVVSCSGSELWAQGGGMMRMMGGGMTLDSSLLAMEEVQQELNFTDEQMDTIAAKATEINDALRSEMRAIFQDGGDMSEIEDLVEELREEEQEFVALLEDEQQTRLKQLRYQRMGNAMYQDEEVQAGLTLSDDQVQSINDAFTAAEDAMNDARESGDFGAMREIMGDIQKELTDAINGTLSEDQKQAAADLQGEPFEFPERRRRQRRSDF